MYHRWTWIQIEGLYHYFLIVNVISIFHHEFFLWSEPCSKSYFFLVIHESCISHFGPVVTYLILNHIQISLLCGQPGFMWEIHHLTGRPRMWHGATTSGLSHVSRVCWQWVWINGRMMISRGWWQRFVWKPAALPLCLKSMSHKVTWYWC